MGQHPYVHRRQSSWQANGREDTKVERSGKMIQAGRRETLGAKPEEDKVIPGLEVVVPGLDWRKSEAEGWKRD